MTTTSHTIAELFRVALLGKTAADQNVFGLQDWPTTIDEMPIIIVRVVSERKDSLGKDGAPEFDVTSIIHINARMTAVADSGDAGAEALFAALSVLQRQIEVATINEDSIMPHLQQYVAVESAIKLGDNAEQHVGELAMAFTVEFRQEPEDFATPVVNAIEEMRVFADLVNVRSPTGTFVDEEPFGVQHGITPAPRTQGPDGRPEGIANVNLT